MPINATYSQPQPLRHYPHVLKYGACTIIGADGSHRSSWGYKMECTRCGAAEETPICSSVTSEDGPYFFAREHAECQPAAPVDHFHDCVRCGQVVITRQDPPICQTCRKHERAPQGAPMKLFTPAPNQIPGQLTF